MAELINGRNIILYKYDETTYEDIPFACATASSLSIQTDGREITSQSSAFFREFQPDVISWSMTASGFMILSTEYNYLALLDLVTNRTLFTVKFVIDNGTVLGLSIFTGQVYISSFTLDAPDDVLGTYSVELTGTGAYSTSGTTVTPGGIIITGGSIVQVFQTTATDGQTSITFAGAIGLELLYASRGGIAVQPIGTLTGNGGTWDIATGVLTLATPAVDGELFLVLCQ
jgi:predicted secreted protein